ncbi:SlyX family protein [Marispirochaeta aestuarii]|uniref:SlyX family protein n=1 Tax=Marispirochaeta aestuarii TaxID=1963862 RepID=UPI0029C8859B|nr:SlyX family protein [Marispirochaeta aestuarii]
MDEELLQLQTKLSYQESALADLNDTVISQQQEIDRIRKTVDLLVQRVRDLQDLGGEEMPHVPPPHY